MALRYTSHFVPGASAPSATAIFGAQFLNDFLGIFKSDLVPVMKYVIRREFTLARIEFLTIFFGLKENAPEALSYAAPA